LDGGFKDELAGKPIQDLIRLLASGDVDATRDPDPNDDDWTGNDFLTCCDHPLASYGRGLFDNCSCCPATVCRMGGTRVDNGQPYNTCCDSTDPNAWGPSCAQLAYSGVCAGCGGIEQ
jgi:hypothetical protein